MSGRRSARSPVGTLPGLALLLGLVVGCAGNRPTAAPGLERFEFVRPEMGVPFRLVFYAGDASLAEKAAEAAFDRVARLNAVLSDYDPDSEMNRVCHETPVGIPAPVGPELWTMLARSRDIAALSDGAFDVTVGPFVNLWRRARRLGELPREDLLAGARPRVGWRNLELDPTLRTVTFLVPGMRLDFGGIAKGYAADEARRILARHGLTRVLVGAAGDVVAGDPPPGFPGWRVEIGLSDATNAPPPRFVLLRNGAVSTSGDLFQRLEIGGRRYSHILDPRTGIGLTESALVTVLARDGVTADGVSTAISVLGPARGLALVEGFPGAAALIVSSPPGREVPEVFESRRLARWRIEPGRITEGAGGQGGVTSRRKN